MKDKTTSQINFKCPEGLIKIIDQDVEESEEFRNRSEWIIAAARFYTDHRTMIKSERRKAAETTTTTASETDDYVSAHPNRVQYDMKG
ncbi:MAG: hypothetical protein RBR71_13365 [Gudongella sp.]|nr:hypothetical protein [Gudongella sp.]